MNTYQASETSGGAGTEAPGTAQATDWPACATETVQWVGSGRGRKDRSGPYEATVTARIAEAQFVLSSSLAADVTEATAELRAFDESMTGEIAPLATVLLRSESVASSQIEGLSVSARALAEAEIGESKRAHATEIARNVVAMRAAVDLSERLDGETMLAMHAELMADQPHMAGRWRGEPVWIGGSSFGPHGADYVAPVHERVPAAVDDLCEFMRREDLPALAQAAIAHAHFETIHPFPDGNGRTGRALLSALLRHRGVTRHITVPISSGLLANRDTYFAALVAYRRGDIVPIIHEVALAAADAVVSGRELLSELRAIREEWNVRIRARADSGVHQLADLLLSQPVVTSPIVADHLGVHRVGAQRHLQHLVDAGVLIEASGKARNRVWRAPDVLEALDDYDASRGRPRL